MLLGFDDSNPYSREQPSIEHVLSCFNWVFLQQHLKDQDVPHQHPKEALSMNLSTILSDKNVFLLYLAHEAQVNKWGKVVQEDRKHI